MKIIGCDLHQLRQDENEVDEFVVASHYFEWKKLFDEL
jgi:hypothetical protein